MACGRCCTSRDHRRLLCTAMPVCSSGAACSIARCCRVSAASVSLWNGSRVERCNECQRTSSMNCACACRCSVALMLTWLARGLQALSQQTGLRFSGLGWPTLRAHPLWFDPLRHSARSTAMAYYPADSVAAVAAPLDIPIHYEDFTPQISTRAKEAADAPTLEAIAVTLATRRLTRSVRHHGTRAVLLVDAQALMYALRKGRSSSAACKTQLQKIAAPNLCADVAVTYGYIPTACNPADPPSVGSRNTTNILI